MGDVYTLLKASGMESPSRSIARLMRSEVMSSTISSNSSFLTVISCEGVLQLRGCRRRIGM